MRCIQHCVCRKAGRLGKVVLRVFDEQFRSCCFHLESNCSVHWVVVYQGNNTHGSGLQSRHRRIMPGKSGNYAFMDSRIMLAKSSYYALARGDTYSLCCACHGTSNNMESFGAIYVTRYKPHEYDGSLRFGMKLMSLSVWFHDFASQPRIYYLKALERDTQYPDNLREKEGKRNSYRGQPAS